jgi:hypothetical protein
VAIAVGTAVAIALIGGHSLPDYDATFALIWGRDLVHGNAPDYSLPFRPAGHPLTTFIALLGRPLGNEGAAELMRWVALLGAGAFVAAVFRFGQAAFGTAAGIVAAVLLATRSPLWGFSQLAYMDMWAAAFVVWAGLLELRTPRRGAPVLALLALAGLLRPEVWLFAGAYWLWIGLGSWRRAWRLLPLALLAPITWAVWDLVTVQTFLGSLTTEEGLPTASSTGGHGLGRAPGSLARFLGGFARPPEVFAAAIGLVLVWRARLWRRAAVPIALAALNLLTFVLVAQRHGPLEQRYLLVAAAMLLVFAGHAIGQALAASSADPRERRVVRIAGVALALACLAYAPIDIRRLDDLHDQVAVADTVYSDLRERVEECDFASFVQVPDVRLRPQVAYWAEIAPVRVGTGEDGAMDAKPGPARITPIGPVAAELSSRSLPSDPDASPGAPPFWKLTGCARQ